ncbi:MAG: NAD(P)/FAD-dependent oxidoreductase [Acidimicrobiales bacterium]
MASQQTFVIVGAGLAGAKAAESLRAWGFDGRVVLVGEEPLRPYQRPPLSKSYLRGRSGFEEATVHPASFYEDKEIELLTSTRVTRIDPRANEVELSPGERELPYDALLLATGARPRPLTVPGADLGRVFHLRSFSDAEALRRAARAASKVAVIGTGWVGTEVAASPRRLGLEVVLVGRGAVPLQRALGPEVGQVFADLHTTHGVEVHLGVGVEALGGRRWVEEVRLTDGSVLHCDLVVAGLGALPRAGLAQAAGLAVADGVLTDSQLETSAPGIFAAGDVANLPHPALPGRIRVEHWWGALTEGPVAAANMVGQRAVYDWIPTFTSKQFDLLVEYTGQATGWDQVVVRGDPASGSFVAFWLQGGRMLAGLNANAPGLARHIQALVTNGQPVDPRQLADPDVDLAALGQEEWSGPAARRG